MTAGDSAMGATTVPQASDRRAHPPGTFVLGMHRSGTSVVAGILDRLGLDGGSRETMFDADRFNADGYWEQRPLVEMHDRMLRRLGGWASAPPARSCHTMPERLADVAPAEIHGLLSRFDAPWFVKDPRHCLLLPVWTSVLGSDDLAIAVVREPEGVIRSLRHRNGYGWALAAGLWERYTRDLLVGLAGRPCLVVRYERLLAEPRALTTGIAAVVGPHVGDATLGRAERVDHAAALVREPASASRGDGDDDGPRLLDAQLRLRDVVCRMEGYHPRFAVPDDLPAETAATRRRFRHRRAMLRTVSAVMGRDAASRSRLDRVRGRRA